MPVGGGNCPPPPPRCLRPWPVWVLCNFYFYSEEGSDYEGFNNTRVGPFTPEQPKQCFSLNIMDDAVTEEKEDFTLEISREPNYVMVVQRTTFVTINNVVKKGQ